MRCLPMCFTVALALAACAAPGLPKDPGSPAPETPIRGTASKRPTPEPSPRPSFHNNGHRVIHGYWVVVEPGAPCQALFDACDAPHTGYDFRTDGYGHVTLDVRTYRGASEPPAATTETYHLEGEWIESKLRMKGERTIRSNSQDDTKPVVEPVEWVFDYDQKAQHHFTVHDGGKTRLSLSWWPRACAERNPWPYGMPTPSPQPGESPRPSPALIPSPRPAGGC